MSFKAVAAALVNRLGTTITLTNPGAATYDPATGTVTNGTGGTATAKADITNADASRVNLEVEAGDLIAAIPASSLPTFTPSLQTRVTLNGETYRAIAINDVYAFNELTLYEIQLRRIS